MLGAEMIRDYSLRHVIALAPPGGGKTETWVKPTLALTWKGSAFIHDRKGDLWETTAAYRRRFSHVLRFAPTLNDGVGYNPLMSIRRDLRTIRDAQAVVEHLPLAGGNVYGGDTIWDENSKDYLAALIIHVLSFWTDERKNLHGIRDAMLQGKAVGEEMIANQHPDPDLRHEIANAAKALWENANEKYVFSIVGTINSYLRIYADPLLRRVTATSNFSASEMMCGEHPLSLYLHIPPSDSDRLKPLVKMLISHLLDELMTFEHTDRDGVAKHFPLLWMLDEFYRLGRIDAIEGAIADMRSYGMRAFLILQSPSQIPRLYGHEN